MFYFGFVIKDLREKWSEYTCWVKNLVCEVIHHSLIYTEIHNKRFSKIGFIYQIRFLNLIFLNEQSTNVE